MNQRGCFLFILTGFVSKLIKLKTTLTIVLGSIVFGQNMAIPESFSTCWPYSQDIQWQFDGTVAQCRLMLLVVVVLLLLMLLLSLVVLLWVAGGRVVVLPVAAVVLVVVVVRMLQQLLVLLVVLVGLVMMLQLVMLLLGLLVVAAIATNVAAAAGAASTAAATAPRSPFGGSHQCGGGCTFNGAQTIAALGCCSN